MTGKTKIFEDKYWSREIQTGIDGKSRWRDIEGMD